jgi:hypothetical protein
MEERSNDGPAHVVATNGNQVGMIPSAGPHQVYAATFMKSELWRNQDNLVV